MQWLHRLSFHIRWLRANHEVRKLCTLQRRRRRRELALNVTIGSVTVWAGDYALQELYDDNEPFNTRRSGAFMLWGALMGGWAHVWYKRMAKVPSMVANPLRQVALYQTVFLPLEYVGFYSLIGAVEGESVGTIRDELSGKFVYTLVTDWVVYTPALVFIVRYLPVRARAAADCGFTFLWCVFLSFLKHNEFDESAWSKVVEEQKTAWMGAVAEQKTAWLSAVEVQKTALLGGMRERCGIVLNYMKHRCSTRTMCSTFEYDAYSEAAVNSSSSLQDHTKNVSAFEDFIAKSRCCENT